MLCVCLAAVKLLLQRESELKNRLLSKLVFWLLSLGFCYYLCVFVIIFGDVIIIFGVVFVLLSLEFFLLSFFY